MHILYLAGPMTGKAEWNFPRFHEVARQLRSLGWCVVNPAELCPDTTAPWSTIMRRDLKALLDCDTLVLLEGWEDSRGTHLEIQLAHRIGIRVRQLPDVLAEGAR
jgi:nucleoside 2-deoxyribosyltransferase